MKEMWKMEINKTIFTDGSRI